MEHLRWIAAAALSAYACHLAVHAATPIDAALPLIAIAVTFLAWLTYPELMLGVPMLIVAEIALPDEHVRLLTVGAIVAACMVVANAGWASARPSPGRAEARPTFIALTAVLFLRWIPLAHVLWFRELVLLALTVAIVLVLGRTPFAVLVAVITALITPAVPMRTLIVPILVLIIAAAARTFGLPRLRLTWASSIVLGFVMLFFAWSGIVARAFPYFLKEPYAQKARWHVGHALVANDSRVYEVPWNAKALILSGANVADFRRGAVLGRIEPGHIVVRIDDAADWGYLRRDAFHKAHNPLPRVPAGRIRDYGYAAWVDGAGRIALPKGARVIRVTADAKLPEGASLQVEGFELE
ncbi:MAG TPA: hypothetical protein VM733_07640 [Thermoanaerobaculia bacterium]|nr:hypothetical protein [Thermoanaerobaculia bacterium]